MADANKVTDAVRSLLLALEEGGFEYALIGGIAVVLRGHDRYTQDVDGLVWDLDDRLEELSAILPRHGFQPLETSNLREAASARILHAKWGEGIPVDIMLGLVPFERETLDNATSLSIGDGLTAKVAAAEDLVIMKLIASRPKDLIDILALVELYPDLDWARIRSIVEDYAEALERPEILENLDRLP